MELILYFGLIVFVSLVCDDDSFDGPNCDSAKLLKIVGQWCRHRELQGIFVEADKTVEERRFATLKHLQAHAVNKGKNVKRTDADGGLLFVCDFLPVLT